MAGCGPSRIRFAKNLLFDCRVSLDLECFHDDLDELLFSLLSSPIRSQSFPSVVLFVRRLEGQDQVDGARLGS